MAYSMKEVVALLLLQLGNSIDLLLEVLWIEVGGFECSMDYIESLTLSSLLYYYLLLIIDYLGHFHIAHLQCSLSVFGKESNISLGEKLLKILL